MKTEDPFKETLLKTIDPLPHNVFDFTKLDIISIDLFGCKAALLVFNLSTQRRTRWLPYSQLKKDNNNLIWIANWLIERIKSDGKND